MLRIDVVDDGAELVGTNNGDDDRSINLGDDGVFVGDTSSHLYETEVDTRVETVVCTSTVLSHPTSDLGISQTPPPY